MTFSTANTPPYRSSNGCATGQSARQEKANNSHHDAQSTTFITDCSKNLDIYLTCKTTNSWNWKKLWTHFVNSMNTGRITRYNKPASLNRSKTVHRHRYRNLIFARSSVMPTKLSRHPSRGPQHHRCLHPDTPHQVPAPANRQPQQRPPQLQQ